MSGCTEQGQPPTEFEVTEVNPPATDANLSRKYIGTNEGHVFRIQIDKESPEYDRPYTYSLRDVETDEIITQQEYDGSEWISISLSDPEIDEYGDLRFVLNNGTTHYGQVIFARKESSTDESSDE